jgi:miniconductance mechanosensitive channel
MSEAGGRRIARSLRLDLNSVHFLTDDEIRHLGRYEFLADYMRRKREELAEANGRTPEDPDVIPERRRLTNLGTFRAYVVHYLRNHPRIHQDMTLLVRQLEPGSEGVPLQIYCFTNDTAWANYEGIQGDIFDHLIAILPEFGLRPFQQPAGSDFRRWAEAGQAAD